MCDRDVHISVLKGSITKIDALNSRDVPAVMVGDRFILDDSGHFG